MLAEIILAYNLSSNEPLFLRDEGPPYADMEVALHVRQPFDRFFLDLEPYVVKTNSIEGIGRAGAFIELGWEGERWTFSLRHHSSHCTDVDCESLQADGFRVRYRLK